ncbi:aldehyde dehydrogenase family protein [Gordonia insulae]|uniref:NAD/NADP-dependent betaine aldehyde dehydrogenase n=1 Tax=Gordonia insulae TaxID=2420509 RepID=A0A3G8JL85_9ACTN|nr:aldehyde dehydrogenase family protein [Gordonia insulae]AZG45638.1 NAD/NADP-dependent betaine aldehyde dehydrogenase [Gordonia insulae]
MSVDTEQGIDHQASAEAALTDLSAGEKAWSALSLLDRAELLDRVRALTGANAADWVAAAAKIKRLGPHSALLGEEWMSGPYAFATGLGAAAQTLRALAAGRSPVADAAFGTAAGRTTVRVLPSSPYDSLLLGGFSADVWLQPGADATQAKAAAGLAQLDPTVTGGIGVVLGAGNISSIAPLDVIYELLAHNRVVALKLNPLTDPLLPVLERILEPLISLGAIRILTGGADIGEYLVSHDAVAHVHMTGSANTHDAIVWGTGEEAERRRASGEPRLTKPITSELGGVSPAIVVPGRWSTADLRYQAEHIATQRLHNGGYNCVAAQVVIVSADWDQKQEFLDALRDAFASAPARVCYYPGSDARVGSARSAYPTSEPLGTAGERLLVTGLSLDDDEDILHTEYFGPVLGVLELPGTGAEFLTTATDAANNHFLGTLGINVIAHPASIAGLGAAFESMIADLRYGTIAVNAWTGVGFLTAAATWGAFPGHTIDDVQSGTGVVHNAFLLADTERTVVRGPFRPAPRSILHREWSISPKPPWFVTNRTAATTGRLLADFASAPSPRKLPAIFASALRG